MTPGLSWQPQPLALAVAGSAQARLLCTPSQWASQASETLPKGLMFNSPGPGLQLGAYVSFLPQG